jgi:transposase
MIDTDKLKANIKRDLELLHTLREELRLQATLAKADVKSEWAALEARFELAQEEWKRAQGHSKTAMQEIETNLQTMIEELKRSYEALRRILQA